VKRFIPYTAPELEKGKSSPAWQCLVAASIPVVYISAYLAIGGIYPQWDPAEYMGTGLSIYHAFVDHGFVEGIRALYFHRGWRPSLAPALIVPFYALTGGKALAAMHIVCPVLYSVLMLYVSLLLRLFLRGIPLFFALLLTGTQITLITIGLDFWSELPYCAACAATFYHFYRSDNFQNRGHCFAAGIALGLALCFRPIVGAGTLVAPLFLYLYLSVKRNTIQWRDIAVWSTYAAAGVTIAAGLLLIPGSKSWFRLGLLGCLILLTVTAVFGYRKRFRLSTNNLLVASAAFALPVWWFGLFVLEVGGWTLTNTYGELVRVVLDMFPHPREAPLSFLKVVARNTVTVPSLGVLLVAAAAMSIRTFRWGKAPGPRPIAMVIGAMCIVPLLGTLTTYNGDPRYLIIPAFVLVLSCTAWFLAGAQSSASAMRRMALLSPALILQVIFLASRMAPLPDNMQRPLDRYLLSPIFPQPYPSWLDQHHPAKPVYERILELVGKSSKARIGLINPRAFAYLNLPDVNLIAAENRQELAVSLASEKVPREPGISNELRVRHLAREYTHVLIGPLGVWDSVPDPIRSLGEYLIDQSWCYEKTEVPVPSINSDAVRKFVLVPINSSDGLSHSSPDCKNSG